MKSLILLFHTLALFLTMCFSDDKHWPDFSCHPATTSNSQLMTVDYHRMGWNSCLEPYEKWNGTCHKVCMLRSMEILIRKVKGEPRILDVDEFMTRFARELGIKKDNQAEAEKNLMTKVRSGMEQCKQKHPEVATLTMKNAPCEPWSKITSCVEDAIGCGRMP